MRLVTEQELKDIERGVTWRDLMVGMAVGAIMGLVYYGSLLVGIG